MHRISERLAAYYREAQLRARRRKSAWNLLLFPLSFGSWMAIWYALFRLVWAFHTSLYPNHRLADFWPQGIHAGSFALSFLMVFALAPAAMVLGFMLANVLVWLVPVARHRLDNEARGFPGTTFAESMWSLGKMFMWSLPIGLSIALAAASCLESLH